MTRRSSRHLAAVIACAASFVSAGAVAHAADTKPPTVAQCLEANESTTTLRKAHSLLEARATAVTCSAATCPADVRAECLRDIDQINGILPSIVFAVRDGSAQGQELTRVTVSEDGKPWLASLDGSAQSLDPGSHHFEFFVDGASIGTRDLVIHEGEKSRRETIVRGGTAPAGAANGTNGQMSADAAPPRTWQKPLGEGLAVLGVVGIGVGTYFGLHAISKSSSSKDECASTDNCTNRALAQSDHDSAVHSATGSTVAFGVGLVALAAGVVLFVTAPSQEKPVDATSATALRWTPSVGPGSAGMTLGGAF